MQGGRRMPINEYIYVICRECDEKFFLNESVVLMEEMVACPGCGSRNIEKEKAVATDLTGEFRGEKEEVKNGYV